MRVTSRTADSEMAYAVNVDNGDISVPIPASASFGTTIEVRDLFYATPARLKFLKIDRTESEAIRDTVRRLAMSRPNVAFTLAGEERAPVTWPAALPGPPGRLAQVENDALPRAVVHLETRVHGGCPVDVDGAGSACRIAAKSMTVMTWLPSK